MRKSGDAVGRPSRRSSLRGDPGEKFLGGKLKSSLNSVSACLKVVDTRRISIHPSGEFVYVVNVISNDLYVYTRGTSGDLKQTGEPHAVGAHPFFVTTTPS